MPTPTPPSSQRPARRRPGFLDQIGVLIPLLSNYQELTDEQLHALLRRLRVFYLTPVATGFAGSWLISMDGVVPTGIGVLLLTASVFAFSVPGLSARAILNELTRREAQRAYEAQQLEEAMIARAAADIAARDEARP